MIQVSQRDPLVQERLDEDSDGVDRRVEELAIHASLVGDLLARQRTPDRVYGESARQFVYGVVRDLVEVEQRHNQLGVFLDTVIAEYDVDRGADELVVAHLGDVADDQLSRTGQFIAAVFSTPERFQSHRREEFNQRLHAGREEAAARLLLQSVYDCFEEQSIDPGSWPLRGSSR